MIGKTIDELRAGDHAELIRRVERVDIAEFVNAVGDHNPLHSDAEFAATTTFREPIAPGVFTAGMISAVIGTRLPGPGAIYLSQSLKFVRPVKIGDIITARVEILEVMAARNRIRLATVCTNQRGEEVLTGEAWVMPSRTVVRYERDSERPARAAALLLQPFLWASQTLTLWSALGASLFAAGARRRS